MFQIFVLSSFCVTLLYEFTEIHIHISQNSYKNEQSQVTVLVISANEMPY